MQKLLTFFGVLAVAFYMLLTPSSSAEWVKVRPIPVQSPINSVDYFTPSSIVVAAADSGYIYRSTDAGSNWSRSSVISEDWDAVACYNNIGVIVGDDGNIHKTENSGETWDSITHFTSSDLLAADIYDDLHIVVGGAGGEIWITDNGGADWSIGSTPHSLSVKSLDYVAEEAIYAIAGHSLWKSENGGVNWSTVHQFGDTLEDLEFVDSQIGFTCGGYSIIYRTLDGGATWDSTSEVYGTPAAIHAEDANNLSVICERGFFWRTQGTFYSWGLSLVGGSFSDIVYVETPDRYIAVGGGSASYSQGPGTIVAVSDDQGDNWSYSVFHQQFPLRSLYFINENEGWAVGGTEFQVGSAYPEVVLHTTDNGSSWETLLLEAGGEGLTDVYFSDYQTGWVSGDSRIWRTLDGGSNWDKQPSGNATNLSFIDDQRGWYCGFFGTIKHTTNGGESWISQSPPSPYDYLSSIDFVDNLNGWSSGYNWQPFKGIIIHTSNGGVTWEYQYDVESRDNFRSMDMWDSQNGVAVNAQFGPSTDVNILRTANGGGNWEPIQVPDVGQLNAVMYADENTIWAAGGRKIIYSTDGGSTWDVDTVLAGHDIYDIFVIGRNKYVGTVKGDIFVNLGSTPVEGDGCPSSPTGYALRPAYPNPFNASTVLEYQLPQASEVNLEVYNLLGSKVATLVNGEQEAGYKSVIWDASEVSSGLYFYKLTAGDYTETRRMMLVK